MLEFIGIMTLTAVAFFLAYAFYRTVIIGGMVAYSQLSFHIAMSDEWDWRKTVRHFPALTRSFFHRMYEWGGAPLFSDHLTITPANPGKQGIWEGFGNWWTSSTRNGMYSIRRGWFHKWGHA